jgi:hypothetical protein
MPKVEARNSSNEALLQNALIILLLALVVLVVLNQANPLTTRLGRDSGMYAYVASHLERGHTPYVSAWEHKPPGIFFIDALGLELAGGTRWGIWFVELISLLVGHCGLLRAAVSSGEAQRWWLPWYGLPA